MVQWRPYKTNGKVNNMDPIITTEEETVEATVEETATPTEETPAEEATEEEAA